jgi:hypothetical protein
MMHRFFEKASYQIVASEEQAPTLNVLATDKNEKDTITHAWVMVLMRRRVKYLINPILTLTVLIVLRSVLVMAKKLHK